MNSLITAEDNGEHKYLDARSYFACVLERGRAMGLLEEADTDQIKQEDLYLFQKQAVRFVSGESSSIREEQAVDVMNSILFNIGIRLKREENIRDAAELLKTKKQEQIFAEGLDLIKRMQIQEKKMYNRIKRGRVKTTLMAYNSAIETDLKRFFLYYDPEFGAAENFEPDYFLSDEIDGLEGIERIREFQKRLDLENQLCSYFDFRDMHILMRAHDANYQVLPVNLFGKVLLNALGCVWNDQSAGDLFLYETDYNLLYKKLLQAADEDWDSFVQTGVSKIQSDLEIKDIWLKAYMFKAGRKVGGDVRAGIYCHRLEYLFVNKEQTNRRPKPRFQDGEKMDDKMFRALVERILACETAEKKAEIIRKNIFSLRDLIDTLEADCIFEGEYQTLYNSYDIVELGLLFKKRTLYIEEINGNYQNNLKDWWEELDRYMDSCPEQKRKQIQKAADNITL